MKPIKLSDLLMALESESDEFVTKVDLENGEVVTVDGWLLDSLESGDDEVLRELQDWPKEEVEIARAILADSDERFIDPPDKFDFHEYRHMERFIMSLDDQEAAQQLWRAIKREGAFRHFRDTAMRLGLLNSWYQYRDRAMRDFVTDWAEANNVLVIDDLKKKQPGPPSAPS